jgi:hypothetical protein
MDKQNDPPAQESSFPHGAPGFLCPSCECPLHYERSHANDRSDRLADLSDYYRCPAGCGTFEYERHRHRLRLLEEGYAPRPGGA